METIPEYETIKEIPIHSWMCKMILRYDNFIWYDDKIGKIRQDILNWMNQVSSSVGIKHGSSLIWYYRIPEASTPNFKCLHIDVYLSKFKIFDRIPRSHVDFEHFSKFVKKSWNLGELTIDSNVTTDDVMSSCIRMTRTEQIYHDVYVYFSKGFVNRRSELITDVMAA